MIDNEANNRKRVTLRDIARLAGVSVPTASLVLSGKGRASRISADADQRVRQVAAEYDYTPNLLVRSMQQGRTHTLSFYSAFPAALRPRGEYNIYMDRLHAGALRAAAQLGYDLLSYCRLSQSPEEVYQSLNGRRADGLLFFGPNEGDPLLELLRRSRLPTVILNHVDRHGDLSYVTDDVEDGMRQLTNALLSHGHRRIGAIASALPGADSALRIKLLRRFLHEAGVELSEEQVIDAGEAAGRSPKEAVQQLLSLSKPPTALFCWHDLLGYEVLDACEGLGIRVPEQLSIVGYDGINWPSTSRHRLASVAVDLDLLAETAAGFLDRLIQGEAGPLCSTYPVSFVAGTTLSAV